jgi:hypothetical protein
MSFRPHKPDPSSLYPDVDEIIAESDDTTGFFEMDDLKENLPSVVASAPPEENQIPDLPEICANCYRSANIACPQCQSFWYCSSACMNAHASSHQVECKQVQLYKANPNWTNTKVNSDFFPCLRSSRPENMDTILGAASAPPRVQACFTENTEKCISDAISRPERAGRPWLGACKDDDSNCVDGYGRMAEIMYLRHLFALGALSVGPFGYVYWPFWGYRPPRFVPPVYAQPKPLLPKGPIVEEPEAQ